MSIRFDTTHAGVLVALALAVLLVGCGGSSGNGVASKSPAEILAASKAAAEGASSVHVVSKSAQGPLSSTSNLQLTSNGGRAQVFLLGLVYEAIRIGETAYLKGNPAFYRNLNAATANAVGNVPAGMWLKVSATDGAPPAQAAAVTQLRDELNVLLGVNGHLAKGATTTINGQKAIQLMETARLFTDSLYIATTGKPYPIEFVKHGRETGQTTFSDWDKPVSLNAPAKAIAIK